MAKLSTGKGRGWREGPKLQARRAVVFGRWRAGESMRQIAASIVPKISLATVHLDCQLALKEWREQHRGAISEAVEYEWELLNWIQVELQQAHEDSKDSKLREKLPDPRYAAELIRISGERRKLLGVDKPTKIEAQTTAEVNVSSNFKSTAQLKSEVEKRMKALKARKEESAK